jgi:hypothetical protein
LAKKRNSATGRMASATVMYARRRKPSSAKRSWKPIPRVIIPMPLLSRRPQPSWFESVVLKKAMPTAAIMNQ